MSRRAASGNLEDATPLPTHATAGSFGEAPTDLAVEAVSMPIAMQDAVWMELRGWRVTALDVSAWLSTVPGMLPATPVSTSIGSMPGSWMLRYPPAGSTW